MLEKIQKYILDNSLFSPNDTIVVAVSCGADSIGLLHILLKLKYNVIIAHVNHQKREQSKDEEIYITNFAKENNIPCEVLHLDYSHQSNFHDEAHKKRYSFFKEVLEKYDAFVLATAHHADDNAETIFLNIMRGSNLFGYAGISNKTDYQGYTIVRPLLCLSKEDILEFVTKEGLTYFEDESNHEDNYRRNRIRHHVLPALKKECPEFLQKINSFSIQAKEAFAYLRKDSIKYLDLNNNTIDVKEYKLLPLALKKDILCLLLERAEINRSERLITSILHFIEEETHGQLDLEGNYILIKRYGKVYLHKNISTKDTLITINLNEVVVFNEKYRFYFTKKLTNFGAKYIKLCYNELVYPLYIRNYLENDVILMPYGRKKINRLFIDKKIPLEKRKEIPIILNGDEILWVYDLIKSNKLMQMKDKHDIYLVCEEI